MSLKQDTKVDMFSAGVTVFVAVSKQHPFPATLPAYLIRRTLSGRVHWKAVEDVNLQNCDLLASLLQVNQLMHPSANQALRHMCCIKVGLGEHRNDRQISSQGISM